MDTLTSLINKFIYKYFYIKNPNRNYPNNLYLRFDIYDDGYQILLHSCVVQENKIINCDLLDFIDITHEINDEEIKTVVKYIKKQTKLMGYEDLNDKIRLIYSMEEKMMSNFSYTQIIIDFSYSRLKDKNRIKAMVYKFIQSELEKEVQFKEQVLNRSKENKF